MKKEMIISILVGLIFGLIIVYGVYTAQTSLSEPAPSQAPLVATPENNAELETESQLAVHSPEDELITDQATLTVAGSAQNEAYIVVFTNDEAQIVDNDETGHFSVETELEAGSNVIQVFAIGLDGQSLMEERTIIYTTQPLVETEQEATDSAETNEETINE